MAARRKNPYRMRKPRNPYRGGGNPMPGMMRDMGKVTMGVVGIGAMTTIGMGALNAIKPS